MTRDDNPMALRLELPRGYERSDTHRVLSWNGIRRQLAEALNYWLVTSDQEGVPHVTPVWGTWVDDAFYFTGIPTAKWARNIETRPRASIHLESGDNVVIVDGVVEDLPSIQDEGVSREIVDSWTSKYGRLIPDPVADGMFCLRASKARGWTEFPNDVTSWTF